MNMKNLEHVCQLLANEFPERLVLDFPVAPTESFLYIGTGEKGEKYTLRRVARHGGDDNCYWSDKHWQDNLEHLGENPEIAIRKALDLAGDKKVYFSPFTLVPGTRGLRPSLPVVPAIKRKVTFGKYRGMAFGQVLEIDPTYLKWLATNAHDDEIKAIAVELVGEVHTPVTESQNTDWKQYQITFGKYRGKTVGEILRIDPGYVFWLSGTINDLNAREGITALLAPANIPFDMVDVEQVLKQANLVVRKSGEATWLVEGNTYPLRNLLSFLGGNYLYDQKCYQFEFPPLEKLVLSIVDVNNPSAADPEKIDPDGAKMRYEAAQARMHFDGQPDLRLGDLAYMAKVSEATKAIMRRGAMAGIPDVVIDEQIIDIGKIVDAFERKEPLFLLASEAGSGKTFVLGGAAKEILRIDPTIRFCYVTLRQGLVKQIKGDLSHFDVVDYFDFHTYSGIGRQCPAIAENTLAIFDESHTAKNSESKTGISAGKIAKQCVMSLYASATPYEDPSEMGYFEASGIFGEFGFQAFAMGYGATPMRVVTPNGYGGTRATTAITWKNSKESLKAAAAGREFLVKRGIFTQRKKRLPVGMVSANFHSFNADDKWLDIYHHVDQAYDYAYDIAAEIGGNGSVLLAHQTNVKKRILEAAKVELATRMCIQSADQNKQSVVFVETKSPRFIGNVIPFAELQAIYAVWASMPPGERDYPPPVSLTQLALAQAFEELNVAHQMPSVVDELVTGLGRGYTGVYVGAKAFDTFNVTDASADKDLAAWKDDKIPFLVATMAKGGTGLSLHPTRKNNERVQIGINLPWTAREVDQVSGRCARYGMMSHISLDWLFCKNIPLERELASKVGARMAGMGASVSGVTTDMSRQLSDWDMEDSESVDYHGFELVEAL